MPKVTVEEFIEIAVPPQRAWALLGDFAGNHRWMPAVTRSEVAGSGLGATRRLHMPDGGYVDERLDALDEAAMHYRYAMYGGVLPVRDYVSELSVSPCASGCRVRWLAGFEPLPGGAVDPVALVREVYRSGLANAKKLLEGG